MIFRIILATPYRRSCLQITEKYHPPPSAKGEIGCFLSHWRLWMHAIKHGYKNILILEDDLRFEFDFNNMFKQVLKNINEVKPDWELLLVLFGAKKFREKNIFVETAFAQKTPSPKPRPKNPSRTRRRAISRRGLPLSNPRIQLLDTSLRALVRRS